ncbi:Tn7 transposase TnsA N-terminal domain-containing protein [Rhizobium laguerreae]|uniref:Tn7 transposase TnsA N-terminal domain-containing protein n=1 Tax=Rhizobium laguerreae TaxID=1076926 RepID=UPI001C9191B9|nr:Tn7 transposase TnsA N-terminal domain-containing protein [Rhizobium laguerreae]MBY3568955.1 hypothetical protein [Rhizobium laguerreae]
MPKVFNPLSVFRAKREEPLEVEKGLTPTNGVQPDFRQQPIAELFWAADFGPVRTIIDGAKTRPTGFIPTVKGGFRTMPWDSQLEERAMQLADISSRVYFLLAQPHRMEIKVRGNRGSPLTYFPDLLVKVDPSLVEDLLSGARFIDAIRTPAADRLPPREWETVILEIKADVDPRDGKPRYREKLEFAKEVYQRRGWHFLELRESAHLKSKFVKTARFLDWRKQVALDEFDLQTCRAAFAGGSVTTLEHLERSLGGGNFGRVKAFGLHYRQIISIDLSGGIAEGATVYLMRGDAQ